MIQFYLPPLRGIISPHAKFGYGYHRPLLGFYHVSQMLRGRLLGVHQLPCPSVHHRPVVLLLPAEVEPAVFSRMGTQDDGNSPAVEPGANSQCFLGIGPPSHSTGPYPVKYIVGDHLVVCPAGERGKDISHLYRRSGDMGVGYAGADIKDTAGVKVRGVFLVDRLPFLILVHGCRHRGTPREADDIFPLGKLLGHLGNILYVRVAGAADKGNNPRDRPQNYGTADLPYLHIVDGAAAGAELEGLLGGHGLHYLHHRQMTGTLLLALPAGKTLVEEGV